MSILLQPTDNINFRVDFNRQLYVVLSHFSGHTMKQMTQRMPKVTQSQIFTSPLQVEIQISNQCRLVNKITLRQAQCPASLWDVELTSTSSATMFKRYSK